MHVSSPGIEVLQQVEFGVNDMTGSFEQLHNFTACQFWVQKLCNMLWLRKFYNRFVNLTTGCHLVNSTTGCLIAMCAHNPCTLHMMTCGLQNELDPFLGSPNCGVRPKTAEAARPWPRLANMFTIWGYGYYYIIKFRRIYVHYFVLFLCEPTVNFPITY